MGALPCFVGYTTLFGTKTKKKYPPPRAGPCSAWVEAMKAAVEQEVVHEVHDHLLRDANPKPSLDLGVPYNTSELSFTSKWRYKVPSERNFLIMACMVTYRYVYTYIYIYIYIYTIRH